MRIIALSTLRSFWLSSPAYSDAETPLLAWYREVLKEDWDGPDKVKAKHRNASFVGDSRVIFNIGGNKYRLIVHIHYSYRIVRVCWVGTHAEYDKINAEEV